MITPEKNMRENCKVCETEEAKYKCPGCLIRYCSVKCNRQHKSETKCSGQRNKTEFVERREYNESTFFSDFSLLQDVSRELDEQEYFQSKLTKTNGKNSIFHTDNQHVPLNYRQKQLLNQCRKRGYNLKFMHGLDRQRRNGSYFNQKLNEIFWTIELRVYPPANSADMAVKVIYTRPVSENCKISQIIHNHQCSQNDHTSCNSNYQISICLNNSEKQKQQLISNETTVREAIDAAAVTSNQQILEFPTFQICYP